MDIQEKYDSVTIFIQIKPFVSINVYTLYSIRKPLRYYFL